MRSMALLLTLSTLALVVAIRLLPWWSVLALLALLVLGTPMLFKWGLTRLLTIPFRAKGAVLRGADVRVRSIERAEAPAPEPSSDGEATADDGEGREHFLVDVTITPRTRSGPFVLWEPGELGMIRAGARAGADDEDDTCDVRAVDVEQEGHFEPDSGMKYGGPQHLRLRLAVRPGPRVLRFRYYFEVFGDVHLPPAESSRRPSVAINPTSTASATASHARR
jgi:hypothetical protein